MTVDYKATVFLPRTEFGMRANLPTREPEILERWDEIDLYGKLRAQSKGREKFILHDGPPYANGHLHIGHALNKILKDVINRSQQMLGKDANYVPGWDCHGLPIEWKIEERYRAAGKNKDEVPIVDFRHECREFADEWIVVQRQEFKRLGVVGDWDNPYSTMAFAAEAQIARELMKFAMSGQLYRGSKPVMWSVVEKTALAEAEVEYRDYTSDTVYVCFPIVETSRSDLAGASIVIWTTTPWTIPGNRAISFSGGDRIPYALYEVKAAPEDNWAKVGDRFVLARALAEEVASAIRVEDLAELRTVSSAELAEVTCAHPLRGRGYEFDVPMLAGEHVTDEAGTGFVHTAPGHGAEDFTAWIEHEEALKRRGIETRIPFTVDADGFFTDEAPGLTGRQVITSEGEKGDANKAVIEALLEAGTLVGRGRLKHTYPHSWRSKKPIIFRNTPQWFISMGDDQGADGLRAKALKAIDETRFYPASGQNRLRSMIEQRPDWVISRQRAWGVPIAVFASKETGEVLRDETVNRRIADAFEKEGADAWFTSEPSRFLGNDYNADAFEQVKDIADVWFDSGSTHAFVLEARPDLTWPASLYLEGSDQHRGWFHSSLLEACGTRGRAPYEAVLTHGFILDEKAQKMSKSTGNALSPQDVTKQFGADILRLWVVGTDYTQDPVFGPETLKQMADIYRRLRNTLRFLLGNLADFDPGERVEPDAMPELERWVLHRLAELDANIRRNCLEFDFHAMFQALHNFCAVDLSAFYFDIRKDSLYCDPFDSPTRRACRTVLDILYDCLSAWLAPVLCFTAEEVWQGRADDRGDGGEESVHMRQFPEVPREWRDDALAEKWRKVRALRRVVTGALEIERAEKRLGSSLQAHPVVYAGADYQELVDGLALADIVITSDITLKTDAPPAGAFALDDVDGVAVIVEAAEGEKCQRCWKVLPDVGTHAEAPGTCGRCAEAVARQGAVSTADG